VRFAEDHDLSERTALYYRRIKHVCPKCAARPYFRCKTEHDGFMAFGFCHSQRGIGA